ncbi:MAG: hypothetical protein C0596_18975 [Marinilabiliales bacterium]|nr:MAG: hypothetical protein C0596_18975 [Marinilabiliales bacterium]
MKQIVYPNPAHDYIYIENIENNKTQIEVYNSTGQKIIEASNMQKIDISSLTPGLYVVKIKTTGSYFNSKSIRSKFIKK